MYMKKTAILLGSLSLLFSLSACKESGPDNVKIEKALIAAVENSAIETAPAPEAVPEEPKIVPIAVSDESAADVKADTKKEKTEAETGKKEINITDASFGCIRAMTKVRAMYVDNLLGDLEGTLAVANSKEGGVYPPGTVVQLVPGEAMVKRQEGYNQATNDWEFFVLDVSEEGTKIKTRGAEDVKNLFGQDCLSCHAQAEPKWDMVCETGHGCALIPITRDMISALQKTDKRCPSVELSEIALKALKELGELVKSATK